MHTAEIWVSASKGESWCTSLVHSRRVKRFVVGSTFGGAACRAPSGRAGGAMNSSPMGSATGRSRKPERCRFRLIPLSSAARIVRTDSSSSVPTHIQPLIANVPRPIRDAFKSVPAMVTNSMFHSLMSIYPSLRLEECNYGKACRVPNAVKALSHWMQLILRVFSKGRAIVRAGEVSSGGWTPSPWCPNIDTRDDSITGFDRVTTSVPQNEEGRNFPPYSGKQRAGAGGGHRSRQTHGCDRSSRAGILHGASFCWTR